MLGGFAGKLDENQKTMLERSNVRVEDLRALIDSLLDIPHIESGCLINEMSYFSLQDEIEQCLHDLDNLTTQKNIEIIVNIPESLPDIYGSSSCIRQVLQNLISNAICYTDEGSITVNVVEKGREVRVDVIDTGIGIPPGELPQIFDDFFRASNVKVKGTGLGLSIAKRIVEAHGGKIRAETSNSGSTFSFTLLIDKSNN